MLVFPKDANPYRELLYRPMREKYPDISIDYLTGPSANYQTINVVLLPLVLLLKRLQGYRIFHLHWTYLFRIRGSIDLFLDFSCNISLLPPSAG